MTPIFAMRVKSPSGGGGGGTGNAAIIAMSPFYYYDVSAGTSLFQSGTRASPGAAAAANNDPVGLVLDLSGNNRDLSASGTARPLLKISGGLTWIEFDGVNDALIATIADATTNWNCVSGFRIIAAGAGNQVHSHSNGNVTVIALTGGSPGYGMFANPNSGPVLSVATGTDAIVTESWVGSGSNYLQLDKNAAVATPSVTTNFGQDVGIGGKPSGAETTNIRWVGTAKKQGTVFTGTELGTIQTYFGGLQGRTI